MLGFNHLANKSENIQIFYTNGTSLWQTWEKPPFAQNVYIFCIGGGSGGKAGNGGAAGITRTGGGGGASAGYSFGTFSANLLPDVLYISVGPGGAGGAGAAGGAGSAGSAGSLSYVSVAPNTTTQNIVLASGAVAATGPTTPTGGTAGTVWSFTTGYSIPYFGLVVENAGQNGGAGNAGAGVGGDITVADIASGGAGGAGVGSTTGFAGGDILLSAFYADRPGGDAEGGNAVGGLNILPTTPDAANRNLILFTGGSGGGSINNGTGGAGGNGGFGSGGGGGGAGTTGGRGGRGGDGLVIIVSW